MQAPTRANWHSAESLLLSGNAVSMLSESEGARNHKELWWWALLGINRL